MKFNFTASIIPLRLCVREAIMELLIACCMTLLGVSIVFLVPRWLRYTDRVNTRRQAEVLNRRWSR